jgi:hypothetical protein
VISFTFKRTIKEMSSGDSVKYVTDKETRGMDSLSSLRVDRSVGMNERYNKPTGSGLRSS